MTKLTLLRLHIGQYVFGIVYFPGCDVIKFEINLIFLVKLFFLHDQKLMTKI